MQKADWRNIMSFAEFEKEVNLQGKVMAITRVYLKDEEPNHSFGCIYRMFDRILAGETLVTGLGYCGCKGFESNSGLKDELPCIPGGFGKFLTVGRGCNIYMTAPVCHQLIDKSNKIFRCLGS